MLIQKTATIRKTTSFPEIMETTVDDGLECSDKITSLFQNLDFIFQTLRSKKISMSSLHAISNLYVNRHNNLNLSDLAGNLGVTTAGVTSVADSIERLGMARRTVNTTDRRNIHINLTNRGLAFAKWLHETIGRDLKSGGFSEMAGGRPVELGC